MANGKPGRPKGRKDSVPREKRTKARVAESRRKPPLIEDGLDREDLPRNSSSAVSKQAVIRASVARFHLMHIPVHEIALRVGISIDRTDLIIEHLLTDWQESTAADALALRARELQKLDLIESESWVAWEKSKKTHVKKRVRTSPIEDENLAAPTADAAKASDDDDSGEVISDMTPEKDAEILRKIRSLTYAASKLGIDVTARRRKGEAQHLPSIGYVMAAQWRRFVNEVEIYRETREGNPAFLDRVCWCIERRAKMLGLDEPAKFEGLLEFRVAGQTDEETDQQMMEMLANRLGGLLSPKAN